MIRAIAAIVIICALSVACEKEKPERKLIDDSDSTLAIDTVAIDTITNPIDTVITPPADTTSPADTIIEPIVEVFEDANRTFFEYDTAGNFYLLKPWNHELDINKDRDYPLVIYLHGMGGAGNISYLSHIGYDDPSNGDNATAVAFQKEHPSFTLIPQTSSFWSYSDLVKLTEQIKTDYPIDLSRIYLIGYSMGGSGSYAFANYYYDTKQHVFAGIVRLAGQSQTSVRDAIADKSAIWLHIGLNDTETRVNITREAYQFLQDYYPNASETTTDVPISGYTGKTYSIIIDGEDRFKRTEYDGVGHGVSSFPFKDPYLIEWLYKQSL